MKTTLRRAAFALGTLALVSVIVPPKSTFAQQDWEKKAVESIENSDFSAVVAELSALEGLSEAEKSRRDWLIELTRRIRIEFPYNEAEIKEELKEAGLDSSDEQMRAWEAAKSLEMRPIDGERRYFKHAVSNLRRIDRELAKTRPVSGGDRQRFESRIANVRSIIDASDGAGKLTHKVRNRFTCVATIPANAVPAGETVRYWAPFPRESCGRQQDVKLISTDPADGRVAPAGDLQRCVYLEKVAVKDEPTVFTIVFETTTYAQYFSQDYLKKNAKAYLDDEFYRFYTEERLPHMVKSDKIKTWAREIVGDATCPVEKLVRLFNAIDERYPWASSNEYGTMFCIPEYVLREGHGDCGMLSLLLISALRSEGIPAKWQSGWVANASGACGMHDWAEVYFEGVGWVPVDMSYGLMNDDNPSVREFYATGLDQTRLVVNDDIGREFTPPKTHFRSEPVDFQRGEVEWAGGNLYFPEWSFKMTVEFPEK